MANFKPQITVITEESRREYRDSYNKRTPYKTIQYSTYRELKKNLAKHLEENLESDVHVCRSKRGEWGEWFEIWEMDNGKPTIIKQGWN